MPETHRIDDIEALRGISVLLVVFSHLPALLFWWPSWFSAISNYATGWGGVDVFFAISGFVISRDLIPRLSASSSSTMFWSTTGAFWIRRAFRLLPAAWFWMAFLCLMSLCFNKSSVFGSFRENYHDAISVMLYVANLHAYECSLNMFKCGTGGIYWSLSLEEQFYLILPLLFFIFKRKFLTAIVILVLSQLFLHREPWSLGWIFRTDAILLGVLIALWSRSQTYRIFEPCFLRHRLSSFLATSLLLLCVVGVPGYPPKPSIASISTGLLALVSAMLVFIASYDKGYLIRSRHAKILMLWLGSRSYSLYLTHLPAYFLTREIFFRFNPDQSVFGNADAVQYLCLAIPMLIIFAESSYRLIEKPCRRKGRCVSANFIRVSHEPATTRQNMT